MSAASISKIHVTNSTGLSLNERFTAITTRPEPVVARRNPRSRSRSLPRGGNNRDSVDRATTVANRRLLQQLARRHKMQAALKLKRRSMRTAGVAMKRGTVKALRVAANGRPFKANSLANTATMKADFINQNIRRPLRRRSNSVASLAGRLGARRPLVGGAAQRVARRQNDRSLQRGGGRQMQSANQNNNNGAIMRRGRSRSRARTPNNVNNGGNIRTRSLSRGRLTAAAAVGGGAINRGRSRSRNRATVAVAGARAVPIQARLGIRPGNASANAAQRRNASRDRRRGASIPRRGIAQGRVQKRRNSNAQQNFAVGASTQVGRARGRSAVRNTVRGRSVSRTRRGSVGQQQQIQQQQRTGLAPRGRQQQQKPKQQLQRRGRSQQRNIRGNGGNRAPQRNGKTNGQAGQQQQRRGRSRSRGRNLGNNKVVKTNINKDELDKELDQYMATTKSENDMDYLLKN